VAEATMSKPIDSRDAADNPWIEFRPSGIHGTGGFARRKIRKGTRMIEYVGHRISKRQSARQCVLGNTFIFTLNDREDLDGSVEWNLARFVNHSCDPNAEAEQDDDDRIFLVASRTIQPEEEITFNYGYDFSEYQDNPCECGAKNCLGFITAEEFHPRVRRILAAEEKQQARAQERAARAAHKLAEQRARKRALGRRKK
jgi:hypothetical protein